MVSRSFLRNLCSVDQFPVEYNLTALAHALTPLDHPRDKLPLLFFYILEELPEFELVLQLCFSVIELAFSSAHSAAKTDVILRPRSFKR